MSTEQAAWAVKAAQDAAEYRRTKDPAKAVEADYAEDMAVALAEAEKEAKQTGKK